MDPRLHEDDDDEGLLIKKPPLFKVQPLYPFQEKSPLSLSNQEPHDPNFVRGSIAFVPSRISKWS